ncbi:TIM barrel protein [Agrobacterium sp. 22-222-1]
MIAPGSCSVVEQYGDRLITTHINDNFGATDDHLLPFDGRIDWEAVTRAIAATKYEAPLNLETHIDRWHGRGHFISGRTKLRFCLKNRFRLSRHASE